MTRILPALAAALALGACTPSATAPTPPVATSVNALATDASLIAGIVPVVTAVLGQIGGIPATDLAQIDAYAAQVKAATDRVALDTAGVATASEAKQIAAAVRSLAGIATVYVPANTKAGQLLAAANALLPAVLAEAGLLGAASANAPAMSPAQARTVLAGAR